LIDWLIDCVLMGVAPTDSEQSVCNHALDYDEKWLRQLVIVCFLLLCVMMDATDVIMHSIVLLFKDSCLCHEKRNRNL